MIDRELNVGDEVYSVHVSRAFTPYKTLTMIDADGVEWTRREVLKGGYHGDLVKVKIIGKSKTVREGETKVLYIEDEEIRYAVEIVEVVRHNDGSYTLGEVDEWYFDVDTEFETLEEAIEAYDTKVAGIVG